MWIKASSRLHIMISLVLIGPEDGNVLCDGVVVSQCIIHGLDVLKLYIAQSAVVPTLFLQTHGLLPLLSKDLIIPRAKPDTPTLEYHHLDFFLSVRVDNLPLRRGDPVSLSRKGGLVILGYGGGKLGV